MFRSTRSRLLALISTAAITAALVSIAVIGTGAYFTDSNGGQISGNLGTVAVTTSGGTGTDGLDFSFDGLLPGEEKIANVHVQNTGTGSEDIYLAFDNTHGAWSAFNTLGAYGTFTIDGVIYDNLNNQYAWGTDSSGQVISTDPASACYNVPRPAQIKFLPHTIDLGTLGPTASKDFTIGFHFHACMTSGQGAPFGPLEFDVAAFQVGVDPSDQFNGAGRISPLDLSAFAPYTYQDR
jgi:hypothetical protein